MACDPEKQGLALVSTDTFELQKDLRDFINSFIEHDDDCGIRRLFKKYEQNAVWFPDPSKGHPSEFTSSLHLAVRKEAHKCLEALLEESPPENILNIPDYTGKTPLMAAVVNANPKALEKLIKAGSFVNARNDEGCSSLHLLISEMQRGVFPQDILHKVTDLLLSHPDIDIESHNDLGLTPLASAVEMITRENKSHDKDKLILICQKLVKAGASGDAEVRHATVKDNLLLLGIKLSEEIEIFPVLPPVRPIASVFLDMIILNKDIEDIKHFLSEMSSEKVGIVVNLCLGSHTILFRAVDKNNEPLVNLLLKADANPWTVEVNNELPIHRAVTRGNFEILDCIINHMKYNGKEVDLREYSYSLLKKFIECNSSSIKQTTVVNHSKCFLRLLRSDVMLDYTQEYVDGTSVQTLLHVGASFNNQAILYELLCHGTHLGARRTVSGKDCGNVLEIFLTSTLENGLDSCISYLPTDNNADTTENILSDNYTLNMDYRCLVPTSQLPADEDEIYINELDTLMTIRKSKVHYETIKHPLIRSFLYAKWYKTLPLYIVSFMTYFIFTSVLTYFVYNLRDLRILEDRFFNQEYGTNHTISYSDIKRTQVTVYILMAFLVPSVIFMIAKEVYQITSSRRRYFTRIENYRQWCLIILMSVLITAPLGVEGTGHLAAWALVLVWYDFVLILGRIPGLSIYITMLYHVSWSFLKLIFIYGSLILALTISFNMILYSSSTTEEVDPGNFWFSLLKSIIIAAGEFDLSDLKAHFSRKLFFLASTVLIFLVAVFLIFLVLMNLMVGLAVVNTQKVFEDPDLYSLTSRLELMHSIEAMMLRCPFVHLRRYLHKIQLLTGPNNTPLLHAKINKEPKKRLLYGRNHDTYCKLNDETITFLRSHRLQQIEKERQVTKAIHQV